MWATSDVAVSVGKLLGVIIGAWSVLLGLVGEEGVCGLEVDEGLAGPLSDGLGGKEDSEEDEGAEEDDGTVGGSVEGPGGSSVSVGSSDGSGGKVNVVREVTSPS